MKSSINHHILTIKNMTPQWMIEKGCMYVQLRGITSLLWQVNQIALLFLLLSLQKGMDTSID